MGAKVCAESTTCAGASGAVSPAIPGVSKPEEAKEAGDGIAVWSAEGIMG